MVDMITYNCVLNLMERILRNKVYTFFNYYLLIPVFHKPFEVSLYFPGLGVMRS